MPKYKVGEVAASFPKPKESTTESGKKLQSLFSEFHAKRKNPVLESQTQHNMKTKAENKNFKNKDKEYSKPQSLQSERNKKRKFSFCDAESNVEKVMKKINLELDEPMQAGAVKVEERGKNSSVSEIDFPRRKNKVGKFNLNFRRGGVENSPTSQVNKFNKTSEVNSQQTFTADSSVNQKNKFNKTSDVNVPCQVKGFIRKAKYQVQSVANNATKRFKFADTQNPDHGKNTSKRNGPQQAKGFIKKAKHQNRSVSNDTIKNFVIADTENTRVPKYEVLNNNSLLEIKNEKRRVTTPSKIEVKNAPNRREVVSNKPKFINMPDGNKHPNKPDTVNLPDTKQEGDDGRTLFVGNLSPTVKRKVLEKLFSKFGAVERVRCHPIKTDRKSIFQKGDHSRTPFNYAATSIPAFITFKERESTVNALALNGSMFENRHITVDFALPAGTKKVYDNKRSIFIGNLPFQIEDENIWNTFAECGNIESVRLVRDKRTGFGKGFGYVLFSNVQSKEKALALENVEIEGRTIRINDMQTDKKAQRQSNKDPINYKNRDSFKSRAINFKKAHQDTTSRKSIKKIMKKNKASHNKKKIASLLQKSWK